MSSSAVRALENALGLPFKDKKLLAQALTHRSFGAAHNERLEFLGDGILDFVMADLLYCRYPGLPEGDLSRMRANLVCQESLHHIAEGLGIGECLQLGEGELASGGKQRPSILADAVEALLGAAYLDAGFAAAKALIERLFSPILASHDPKVAAKDPKTRLQEWLQARKKPLPAYRIAKAEGAAHDRMFCASCELLDIGGGAPLHAEGRGHSRKAAEQEAAAHALARLCPGGTEIAP
jgi:ribonuclease-3